MKKYIEKYRKENMEALELEEKNIVQDLSKSLGDNLLEAQKSFLESDIGKAINMAVDIGLKSVLPDLIEDQIIDIKDAILEQGFSEGIKEVINSGINFGKSALGIVTGKFENVSQIQLAVKNGGILDKVSDLFDLALNYAKKKNLINNSIANMIKKGKNTIISSISNKIEETLTNQIKAVEKLENYCEKWNMSYGDKDFSEMEKAYKNIKTYLSKTVPLENIINEARKIENLHTLIKNNGKNFDITEEALKLAEKL